MKDDLSKDEFDALNQIASAPRAGRPSACVARNAKRLAGLKFIAYGKDGALALTDKGRQTLFVQSCIDGLRAVAADPEAKLTQEVAIFLGKKGHIKASDPAGRFDITDKGRESLADMAAMETASGKKQASTN